MEKWIEVNVINLCSKLMVCVCVYIYIYICIYTHAHVCADALVSEQPYLIKYCPPRRKNADGGVREIERQQ